MYELRRRDSDEALRFRQSSPASPICTMLQPLSIPRTTHRGLLAYFTAVHVIHRFDPLFRYISLYDESSCIPRVRSPVCRAYSPLLHAYIFFVVSLISSHLIFFITQPSDTRISSLPRNKNKSRIPLHNTMKVTALTMALAAVAVAAPVCSPCFALNSLIAVTVTAGN